MKTAPWVGVIGVVAAIYGCTGGSSAEGTMVAGPVKTAPIAYFDQKCANCHGFEGSNYGPTFGQGLDEAELYKVVKDMAEGRAQAPLDEPDLAVQVAYHRALIAKEPFIAYTGADGSKVKGEVTPGAKVTATSNGASLPVTMGEKSWTVDAGSATADTITVKAEANGKTVTLDLSKSGYSHTRPLAQ